jgi:hypothetical protein
MSMTIKAGGTPALPRGLTRSAGVSPAFSREDRS